MRPSSRSERSAALDSVVRIEVQSKKAAESDAHLAVIDPERFLRDKPRSCIDEFVLALLSHYVTPSSDIQRLILSFLPPPRLSPGDEIK